MEVPYYLGCPIWAAPIWVGKLFQPGAKRADWLRQYASAFNTVEGNSTFYGLPALETVRRWAEETPAGFRFSLKFPRVISHDLQLVAAGLETKQFLEVLTVLHEHDRLGPSFLQLPPQFSPLQLPALEAYLKQLPSEYPYAVEVRHKDFFDEGAGEHRLDDLLREARVDRTLMDTRPLFSQPPTDDFEAEAQGKKPRVPLRQTATGKHPLLRIVGRDDPPSVAPWFREWAPVVAGWIRDGRQPYIFTHAPHDLYAPDLARRFHAELQRELPDLSPLPPWPAELAPAAQQLRLF